MVFGRELIAGDPDHADLRLGRQLRALEAVDLDDGARAGDVRQLPPHLLGILRQRVDLLAGHDRAERDAPAIRRAVEGSCEHGDRVFDLAVASATFCRFSPVRTRTSREGRLEAVELDRTLSAPAPVPKTRHAASTCRLRRQRRR